MAGDANATGRQLTARAEESKAVGGSNRSAFHRRKNWRIIRCAAYFTHGLCAGNRLILNKINGIQKFHWI